MIKVIYDYTIGFISEEELLDNLREVHMTNLTDEEKEQLEQLIVDAQAIIYQKKAELNQEMLQAIANCSVHERMFNSMTAKEKMNLITQYIAVPNPPEITQAFFDQMVVEAIKEKSREKLWRLAVNYDDGSKDFSKIEDYYIATQDADYIIELISATGDCVNIENLIKRIINTNNKDFIEAIIDQNLALHEINDIDIHTLQDALNNK